MESSGNGIDLEQATIDSVVLARANELRKTEVLQDLPMLVGTSDAVMVGLVLNKRSSSRDGLMSI